MTNEYYVAVKEVEDGLEEFMRNFKFIVEPTEVLHYDLIPLPKGWRKLFFNPIRYFFDIYKEGGIGCEYYTGRHFQMTSTKGRAVTSGDIIERRVKRNTDLYVFHCYRLNGWNMKVVLAEFHPCVDII